MEKTSKINWLGLELNRIDSTDVFVGGLYVLARFLVFVGVAMLFFGDVASVFPMEAITGWAFAGFGFVFNKRMGLDKTKGKKARGVEIAILMIFAITGYFIGILGLWLLDKPIMSFS